MTPGGLLPFGKESLITIDGFFITLMYGGMLLFCTSVLNFARLKAV